MDTTFVVAILRQGSYNMRMADDEASARNSDSADHLRPASVSRGQLIGILGKVLGWISDILHPVADGCRNSVQALRTLSMLWFFIDGVRGRASPDPLRLTLPEPALAYAKALVAPPSAWAAP